MIRFNILLIALSVAPFFPFLKGAGQPPFELRDGDRVILLGDGFIERDIHEGYLETAMARRFPGARIVFRNLGWTGDTVNIQMRPLSFGDLESHVTHQRPTVVLVCYGMNDSFEGSEGLEGFREGYAGILDMVSRKVLRSPPRPRIVLLSPIRHENLGPPLPDPAQRNRVLHLYVEAAADLATANAVRFIDLFGSLGSDRSGEDGHPLTESGIHLSPFGYWSAGLEVERGLGWDPPHWEVELDAGSGETSVRGTEVLDQEVSAERVRLLLRDELLPYPPSPTGVAVQDGGLPSRLLRISGLAPGVYELRIGGRRVASAEAEDWGKGVPLEVGPEFEQVEELRRVIVRKNSLFFHRWRPYNTEYIFGRRSEARGANVGNPQFADEMQRFDELIEEAEVEIADLTVPREHLYELVRENPQTSRRYQDVGTKP